MESNAALCFLYGGKYSGWLGTLIVWLCFSLHTLVIVATISLSAYSLKGIAKARQQAGRDAESASDQHLRYRVTSGCLCIFLSWFATLVLQLLTLTPIPPIYIDRVFIMCILSLSPIYDSVIYTMTTQSFKSQVQNASVKCGMYHSDGKGVKEIETNLGDKI